VNKREFIKELAEATGDTQVSTAARLDATLALIESTVGKGERVEFMGFGTFSSLRKPARTGSNPATGELLQIAAKDVPHFKAGKRFKDIVAG
jgi:DNA-binding protein HU-beta